MRERRIERIADQAATVDAERLQRLACPRCKGPLRIGYVSLRRRHLHVGCPQCPWKVISDGLPAEPPWVAVLGRHVTTLGPARVAAVSRQA